MLHANRVSPNMLLFLLATVLEAHFSPCEYIFCAFFQRVKDAVRRSFEGLYTGFPTRSADKSILCMRLLFRQIQLAW